VLLAGVTRTALQSWISDELRSTTPPAVQALAQELARRGGPATAAVLYYGSTLRAGSVDGVLDFYVLLDHVGAWPGSCMARLANRLLPPNVGYLELPHAGQLLRAKYAVLSSWQFSRRLREQSLDTTMWARFCQPAACAWARSPQDHAAAVALISDAVTTAACWAVKLGPEAATALEYWHTLFAHTYAAELRVENSGRAVDIVAKYPDRYQALLPLALGAAGVQFETREHGEILPMLTATERRRAHSRWARRSRIGRPLNILRLLKAAFTFDGAMDYVAWKVERHSGVRIEVAPWQRRFPLLAAPGLYLQLRRRGVLRRKS
jgi:hypothetical protein